MGENSEDFVKKNLGLTSGYSNLANEQEYEIEGTRIKLTGYDILAYVLKQQQAIVDSLSDDSLKSKMYGRIEEVRNWMKNYIKSKNGNLTPYDFSLIALTSNSYLLATLSNPSSNIKYEDFVNVCDPQKHILNFLNKGVKGNTFFGGENFNNLKDVLREGFNIKINNGVQQINNYEDILNLSIMLNGNSTIAAYLGDISSTNMENIANFLNSWIIFESSLMHLKEKGKLTNEELNFTLLIAQQFISKAMMDGLSVENINASILYLAEKIADYTKKGKSVREALGIWNTKIGEEYIKYYESNGVNFSLLSNLSYEEKFVLCRLYSLQDLRNPKVMQRALEGIRKINEHINRKFGVKNGLYAILVNDNDAINIKRTISNVSNPFRQKGYDGEEAYQIYIKGLLYLAQNYGNNPFIPNEIEKALGDYIYLVPNKKELEENVKGDVDRIWIEEEVRDKRAYLKQLMSNPSFVSSVALEMAINKSGFSNVIIYEVKMTNAKYSNFNNLLQKLDANYKKDFSVYYYNGNIRVYVNNSSQNRELLIFIAKDLIARAKAGLTEIPENYQDYFNKNKDSNIQDIYSSYVSREGTKTERRSKKSTTTQQKIAINVETKQTIIRDRSYQTFDPIVENHGDLAPFSEVKYDEITVKYKVGDSTKELSFKNLDISTALLITHMIADIEARSGDLERWYNRKKLAGIKNDELSGLDGEERKTFQLALFLTRAYVGGFLPKKPTSKQRIKAQRVYKLTRKIFESLNSIDKNSELYKRAEAYADKFIEKYESKYGELDGNVKNGIKEALIAQYISIVAYEYNLVSDWNNVNINDILKNYDEFITNLDSGINIEINEDFLKNNLKIGGTGKGVEVLKNGYALFKINSEGKLELIAYSTKSGIKIVKGSITLKEGEGIVLKVYNKRNLSQSDVENGGTVYGYSSTERFISTKFHIPTLLQQLEIGPNTTAIYVEGVKGRSIVEIQTQETEEGSPSPLQPNIKIREIPIQNNLPVVAFNENELVYMPSEIIEKGYASQEIMERQSIKELGRWIKNVEIGQASVNIKGLKDFFNKVFGITPEGETVNEILKNFMKETDALIKFLNNNVKGSSYTQTYEGFTITVTRNGNRYIINITGRDGVQIFSGVFKKEKIEEVTKEIIRQSGILTPSTVLSFPGLIDWKSSNFFFTAGFFGFLMSKGYSESFSENIKRAGKAELSKSLFYPYLAFGTKILGFTTYLGAAFYEKPDIFAGISRTISFYKGKNFSFRSRLGFGKSLKMGFYSDFEVMIGFKLFGKWFGLELGGFAGLKGIKKGGFIPRLSIGYDMDGNGSVDYGLGVTKLNIAGISWLPAYLPILTINGKNVVGYGLELAFKGVKKTFGWFKSLFKKEEDKDKEEENATKTQRITNTN